MSKTVILKLGGSLITEKASGVPVYCEDAVRRMAREVKKYLDECDTRLILVHGAGSFGHGYVKEKGLDKGISNDEQKLFLGVIQKIMNQLNVFVCETLQSEGIRAFPAQVSVCSVMKNGRVVSMETGTIKYLLGIGMIPVPFGTPAIDECMGCSILSGDQIINWLCRNMHVDYVIHASEVDGVFDKDPFKFSDAKLIKTISREEDLTLIDIGESRSEDVTFGMKGKIREILEMHVKTQIVNGNVEGNLYKALKGEHVGTILIV